MDRNIPKAISSACSQGGAASVSARIRERGYALMMVLFMVALVIISTAAVLPSVLTEGKREREDETIWRGQQYTRAVKLYFKKKGHFPTSLDDITKPQDGVRFLRKPYTDPENPPTGAWRLIYVTAAGQLIGSVRWFSLAQMAAVLQPNGTGATGLGGAPGGVPGTGGPAGLGGPSSLGGQPVPGGGTAGQPGSGFGGSSFGSPQSPAGGSPSGGLLSGQPAPVVPGQNPTGNQPPGTPGTGQDDSGDNPPTVIGGNIVGVGSTIKKPSLKVYQGGKKYRDWEFIWNPLLETAAAGSTGPQGAAPAGGAPAPGGLTPQPVGNPAQQINPPPQQTPPQPQ